MKFDSDGIRKIAIVVSGLSTSAADRLLDCLTPEQAQQVRQAVFDLDEVDPQDEQQALEEFFHAEFETQPAAINDVYISSTAEPTDSADPKKAPLPFRFLCDTEADQLTRILSGERPQTIALVLSHLSPEQAGRVLSQWAAPLQMDVIHRLIDLEETDPAILEEVEQALESRLSQQAPKQRRRRAGWQAVTEILEASPRTEGAFIPHTLAAGSPPLAEKSTRPSITFEDLLAADERTWRVLIQAANPEVALLAMIDLPPLMAERILRRLPTVEAERWRHKLAHPGPLRLSDMEEARRELAELARRLANEGRIHWDGEAHLAMRAAA